MAKVKGKTAWWKIALIALVGVVGAGSLAAILHKDKDEDKETTPPAVEDSTGDEVHVCDYESSVVCSGCGARLEVIGFEEVKVGYDLAGYSLRLTVTEEAFMEIVTANSGYLPSNAGTLTFTGTGTLGGVACNNEMVGSMGGIDLTLWGNEDSQNINLASWAEAGVTVTGAVIPAETGNVRTVSLGESAYLFEFYYLGLTTEETEESGATETASENLIYDTFEEAWEASLPVTDGTGESDADWSPLY